MSGTNIKNFSVSIGNFIVSAILGFWFTPFLINKLGVEAYGLIPLAMQITSYMTLATIALNAATSRFVTQSIKQLDKLDAIRFFNTAFFSTIGLAAVLLMPSIWVAFHIQEFISVPEAIQAEAKWLFLSTFGAFLISAIRGPLEAPLFCLNRLDIQNLISALETIIKVGVTVLLFSLTGATLGNIGIGFFTAAISTALLSAMSWRILMPDLKLSLHYFDTPKFFMLTSVGGWSMVNQIGSILFLSIDLIILNRLLGIKEAGIYAALLTWPMVIRTMSSYLLVNFSPTFVHLNATGTREELATYALQSVKVIGLIVVGPIVVLSVNAKPILTTWLDSSWQQHQYLMELMVLQLALFIPISSFFGLLQATTNMKALGLITLMTGLMHVITSIFLCTHTELGIWSVLISGIFWIYVKNLLFLPLHCVSILQTPRFTVPILVKALLPSLVAGSIVLIFVHLLLYRYIEISGWYEIGGVMLCQQIIFLSIFFLLPGTGWERQKIVYALKNILARVKGNKNG